MPGAYVLLVLAPFVKTRPYSRLIVLASLVKPGCRQESGSACLDKEASLVPGSLVLFLKWIDDNERLNVTTMIKCMGKNL